MESRSNPYPAIYYPPYTPGSVFAASAISWGVGVAMGAAWGGGWGWGAGWGHNDIDMNFNNSFNRNNNFNRNQVNALSNRTGAAGIERGSTTRNTAAALLMQTEGLRTDSAPTHEAIPWLAGKKEPRNRSRGKRETLEV
jgi:hypothetical protein